MNRTREPCRGVEDGTVRVPPYRAYHDGALHGVCRAGGDIPTLYVLPLLALCRTSSQPSLMTRSSSSRVRGRDARVGLRRCRCFPHRWLSLTHCPVPRQFAWYWPHTGLTCAMFPHCRYIGVDGFLFALAGSAVVLLGMSGVGKSNLMARFIHDRFLDKEAATVGVDFSSKLLETSDGTKVRAQIWDTGAATDSAGGREFGGCDCHVHVCIHPVDCFGCCAAGQEKYRSITES